MGEDISSIWLLFYFKVIRTSGCFQGQMLSWPVAGSVPDLAAVQAARISLGWIVLVGNNISNVLGKKKKKKGFSFDVSCYAGSFNLSRVSFTDLFTVVLEWKCWVGIKDVVSQAALQCSLNFFFLYTITIRFYLLSLNVALRGCESPAFCRAPFL